MVKKRREIKKKKIVITLAKNIHDKFTIVSNAAITLLDSKNFHIYCYLLSCCDAQSKCYPSYDDMVSKLGIHRNTISECIKFLSSINLIEVNKRKSGSRYNNTYTVYGIKSVSEITEKDDLIIEKELS